MSNYHFEVTIISRGKGRSVTSSVSYISGRALHDIHNGKTYYKHREDLAWQHGSLLPPYPMSCHSGSWSESSMSLLRTILLLRAYAQWPRSIESITTMTRKKIIPMST